MADSKDRIIEKIRNLPASSFPNMMERCERYHCFASACIVAVLVILAVCSSQDWGFTNDPKVHLVQSYIPEPITLASEQPPKKDNTTLTCRITIQRTLYEQDNGDMHEEEELLCRSIVDGRYDKELIMRGNVLPDDFYKKHETAIAHGDLYASLKGVSIQHGKIVVGQTGGMVIVELIEDPNTIMTFEQGRRGLLRNASDAPFGIWTLAIVRITTPDAVVSVSTKKLKENFFSVDVINVISQYNAMSFGQFKLQPFGVYDVFMNQSISLFETASDTIDVVQNAIAGQLGLENPWDLADKVMVCLPIGLRQGFIAFTSPGHWRAMYSDDWCMSLTAMIHEIGHMFGLGHSHINNYDYQDTSCYMSVSTRVSDAPRQAFNGAKHFKLQWYQLRTLTIEPLALIKDTANSGSSISNPRPAQIIQLAAFVDFDKTQRHQPVLVSIDAEYFLQYNRAKGFNNDTRSMADRVTITTISGEFVATERKAGLSPLNEAESLYIESNYRASGHDLYIQVCFEYPGNDNRPDIMIISVGLDYSLCSGYYT